MVNVAEFITQIIKNNLKFSNFQLCSEDILEYKDNIVYASPTNMCNVIVGLKNLGYKVNVHQLNPNLIEVVVKKPK